MEDKIRRLQLVEAFTLILRSQSFPSLKACIVFATFFQTAGVMKITNHLEEVSVFERSADRFCIENPRIRIVHGQVSSIDTVNKIVYTHSNGKTSFAFSVLNCDENE